jgi:hypothetical protein
MISFYYMKILENQVASYEKFKRVALDLQILRNSLNEDLKL